jgi:hypothetical protein
MYGYVLLMRSLSSRRATQARPGAVRFDGENNDEGLGTVIL